MGLPPFNELESKRCFGHRSTTTAVAWNVDGSRLLSAGDASSILVFDTARLQMSTRPETNYLLSCAGHSKNIEVLVASTTSTDVFLSGGNDCLVNVFDTRIGSRPQHDITTDSKCLFADWAPDGTTVAIGASSNNVYFVDCVTWTVRSKLNFKGEEVNQFRWSKDGKRIYFTRGDGTIDVYKWPDMKKISSVKGHLEMCMGLATDPLHRYFTVTSRDSCVSVWESSSLTCLYVMDRWEVPVNQAEYSFDGHFLAFSGDYDRIEIVDAVNGSKLHTISTVAYLNNIAFHPSRLLLAYAPAKSRDRYNAELTPATYVWGFPRSK